MINIVYDLKINIYILNVIYKNVNNFFCILYCAVPFNLLVWRNEKKNVEHHLNRTPSPPPVFIA